jgi:glycosyltransferase involved in cell wall biosynthesis
MRISGVLQVSAYYPPHLGGQEVAVQDLVYQLKSANEKVEVVTSDLGAIRGVKVENGVRVTRLTSHEFGHTAFIWSLFFWLIRKTGRQTIVHLHVGQLFTPEIVWLASKIIRFKYIIHLHADLVPAGPMGRFLPIYKKLFLGREIRDAEVVVVLNDETRRAIHQNYRRSKNLVLMSNGINDDFFEVERDPTREIIRLLFVGRLSPHKNLARLIEALDIVKGEFALDLIGDGECRRGLEGLVEAKNLSNVTFHGRLSRDEIKRFYSTCSALVLPSLHEAQPIVLLEAMACRVPVIVAKATDVAGTIEGAAILIDPTVQGIASGIEDFAAMATADVNLLVDMAFEKAQNYSWNAVIESYIDLYKVVAGKPITR